MLLLAGARRAAQQDYLELRYSSRAPDYPRDEQPAVELGQGLGVAYDWARGTEDARIGARRHHRRPVPVRALGPGLLERGPLHRRARRPRARSREYDRVRRVDRRGQRRATTTTSSPPRPTTRTTPRPRPSPIESTWLSGARERRTRRDTAARRRLAAHRPARADRPARRTGPRLSDRPRSRRAEPIARADAGCYLYGVSYPLDNALYQWEEGYRRLRELVLRPPRGRPPGRARSSAVRDELRRRIGPTFTAAELADLYGRGHRLVPGGRSLGACPSEAADLDPQAIVDGAFYLLPARRHRLRRRPRWSRPSYCIPRRAQSGRRSDVVGSLEHDPVGLDRHLERALAGPVLGVDGVVLDRGVEPEAVAVLLAVVEGRLELLALPAAAAAAGRRAGGGARRPRRLVVVAGVLVGRALLGSSSSSGSVRLVQLGLDLGLDLVAQVDVGRRLLALGVEAVAAAEVAQLRGGDLELVGDPGVGPPLADPGADLVELRLQRLRAIGGGL